MSFLTKSARIGIKTVARDVLLSNYGSFFQHYALRNVVRRLGFLPYRIENSSPKDELLTWLLPIRFLRMWMLHLLGLKDFCGWGGLRFLVLRWRFVRDYRRLIGSLFEVQGNAETYIAGGDSVWYECDRDAFLVGYEGRKIAYGASSLWDRRADENGWCALAKVALESYAAIGIRESAGVQLLRQLNKKLQPQAVVDPVMLLQASEWVDLAADKCAFAHPTLLYYVVNVQDEKTINLEAVEECAERLRCHLVCVGIQGAETALPRRFCEDPSPTRFLAMMRDAQYVVTNSFHGIVFSMLLGRQFAFVLQQSHGGDVNLRQRELLEKFDLTGRMLGIAPTAVELSDTLTQPIDMAVLGQELARERRRSLDWLEAALNEVT